MLCRVRNMQCYSWFHIITLNSDLYFTITNRWRQSHSVHSLLTEGRFSVSNMLLADIVFYAFIMCSLASLKLSAYVI